LTYGYTVDIDIAQTIKTLLSRSLNLKNMVISRVLIAVMLCMQSHALLAATSDGRWQLGIGDPTIWGWLTVGMYLLAMGRCFVKANSNLHAETAYRFWTFLGWFLLLLAINKQLDLQTVFTLGLKQLAIAQGWYEQRRALQIVFVVCIGLTMLVLLLTLRVVLFNLWRQYKLVWMGLFLLSAFILIRAASFHHIDIFIRESLFGLELNVVLENLALLMIILGTFWHRPSSKFAERTFSNTVRTLKDYYEASKPGDPVFCPRCATKANAKAAHERTFKCKYCAFKYLVYVTD
jgi:hypothetical protein